MKTIIYLTVAFIFGLIAQDVFGQQKVYHAENDDSILRITFPGGEGVQSQGSCSVLESNLVLTAGHVVGGSVALVTLKDKQYSGRVIAIDLYNDRALVRLNDPIKTKTRPIRKTALKDTEPVWAIGYGRGFGYTKGKVSGTSLRGRSVPGDSGGAIVDKEGYIVGIVQGYSDDGFLYGHGRSDLYQWVERNKYNEPIKLGGKDE